MDLVFFGSGAFGLPTLQRLSEHHRVRAVVTQPDRPAGRGSKTTPTPIAHWAESADSIREVLRPDRVRTPEVVDQIRAFDADAWVVIAYGQKLPPDLLADRFAINLHASLLPRWRGAAPINAAILAGDCTTGNSVITLADRMDAGLVLAQQPTTIDPNETAGELHDRLAAAGPELVMDVLDHHAHARLEPATQDESAVTLAGKLSKADGWIDFSDHAERARCRVHGLTPWPGVTARFRDEPVKLKRVQAVESDHQSEPGTLLNARDGLVACAGSALRIVELQPPGKRTMAWTDFANGLRVTNADRFEGTNPA